MCLRSQLTDSQSNVKVIKVFPPAVQCKLILSASHIIQSSQNLCYYSTAELHDYMGAEKFRQLGMPLAEFTDQAWAELINGDDEVFVGCIPPKELFFSIAHQRRAVCEALGQQLKSMHW